MPIDDRRNCQGDCSFSNIDTTLLFVSAAINPAHCVAAGPGLMNTTVQTPLNVTIQSKDSWDNSLTTGGVNYTFASTPLMSSWAFYDNLDGTVTLSYIPTVSGNYVIDIRQAGLRIFNSPFTGLNVAAGEKSCMTVIHFFVDLWTFLGVPIQAGSAQTTIRTKLLH